MKPLDFIVSSVSTTLTNVSARAPVSGQGGCVGDIRVIGQTTPPRHLSWKHHDGPLPQPELRRVSRHSKRTTSGHRHSVIATDIGMKLHCC